MKIGLALVLALCGACGSEPPAEAEPLGGTGGNGVCMPGYDGSSGCTRNDWLFEATANGEPMVADWTTVLVLQDVLVAGSVNEDSAHAFAISLTFPKGAGPEIACDAADVELMVSIADPENGRHASSRNGGGCTIRLEREGRLLEGFFEGTAVAYEGEETWEIRDGHFEVELAER